jgi:alkylation response protein AidB-like acyl-CoA dehydrogenase
LISFDLAPETIRLADDVRRWAVEEIRPFAREADRMHDVPELARKAVQRCPVQGAPVGGRLDYPRRGAPDFDPVATDTPNVLGVTLAEAMSYGDVLAHTIMSNGASLADHVVRALGTPEQTRHWESAIERAEFNLMAFAMTEPASGSDPAGMRTSATRTPSGWLLNGHKVFCSNGAIADLLLVFATTDRSLGSRGIRAFVVPREAPGVEVVKANESKLGWRSMMTTEFSLHDVALPEHSVLGDGDDALGGLRSGLQALNFTRGYMGAMVTGIGQAAVDEGRARVARSLGQLTPRRREVIGSEFDRLDAALDRARQVTRRFATLVDSGQPIKRAGSVAKAYCSPLAERIVLRVIQLCGSVGYTEDCLLEKWHRDLKIYDIFEGTANIQRVVIGRELRRR